MPNSLLSRLPGGRRVQQTLRTMDRISQVSGKRAVVSWLGLRLRSHLGIPEPERWKIKPRVLEYPVTQRLRLSSDMDVYVQIFDQDEYGTLRDLQNVRTVMDLGANVGYSSAYFLSCFPEAKLFAVEADSTNFAICRENLRPYGERARVLHAAAWKANEVISLSRGTFGDGRSWATEVVARDAGSANEDVQGHDVPTLIEQSGFDTIDLMKIDVEGSEKYLFQQAAAWLGKVRNLCIELHGPECEKAFFDGMSGSDYELSHSGELTICRNIRKK